MSRQGWRRVVGGLKAQAEAAQVKAKASKAPGEYTLPPFLEATMGQPLSAVRQALKVTDPLAPMNQEEWARVIMAPAPPVRYYSLGMVSYSLDLSPFLTFAFGVPPDEVPVEPEAVGARFLAELTKRPKWLRENAASLRAWFLEREFNEAQHEDNVYNRPAGETLASMFHLADEADAPERLAWWVEHLTGLAPWHGFFGGEALNRDLVAGDRIAPQEARAWMVAYVAKIGPSKRGAF